MVQAVRPRAEIDERFTWDVASVYPSDAGWEAALDAVSSRLPDIERFRGRLGQSAHQLLEFLREEEGLLEELDRTYIYAHMLHDVDTADPDATSKLDRVVGLQSRVAAALAFGEPEILSIGRSTLDRWMEEESGLALYCHYFDTLFARQQHVRSPEVEELLGLVSDPFSSATSIHGTLADADLRFEPATTSTGDAISIAQGNIGALLTDNDRAVRRSAWEHYADSYLLLRHTMAGCLASGVKQHVFAARARRYDSVLEAALAPNHIPVEVFYSLIGTFQRHIPIWHRYWEVKRRALGYDTFYPYDIKAPLLTEPLRLSYEDAVSMVVEGMRPLGTEYVTALERGATRDRWVDVYPNLNKTSGAYSTGSRGTHPFVLLNFNEDIYGMSTLAHEMGHSMHSYYAWQTQPPVYSDYGLFVAEVASNFNQALVRSHLLAANSDRNFQIALIEEAMSNFHRYFFIMPTLARFELEIHERAWHGEPLTADSMTRLMADLFREGYGPGVDMDEERTGITWAQFPSHLYANFYVYQYATGISAANALAERVLSGEPSAAERYLDFLRAGSSLYPLEALRRAGVDMTSPEPVEKAFGVLSQMVERLAQLLAQVGEA
jgi:oligoendopeptidase F